MTGGRYLLGDFLARKLRLMGGEKNTTVVYSPGHLGDVLHAIPMLRALRAGKPRARIIWLAGPWSESLARRYSHYVDEIRIFGPDAPPYTRGRREWRQGAWHQWRLAMELRKEGVEVLIGPLDGVGRFLANAVCPRQWLGIGDPRPPRVRPEIQTHIQSYEKGRYEADALCGLLKPLGIDAHANRLEYRVVQEERDAADVFLAGQKMEHGRSLALIAPGSGWSGKNWLPDRFGVVADWLVQKKGFQVAWVGGPGEEPLVPKSRDRDFNWVGKTALPLLAAVIERARLFVGNDGGLLHLAAAMDVPTVSIWGPTSPGKWGPKGAIQRQIRKVEHCDGCIYWDYREICRHDHACMKAVVVEEVKVAIKSIIKGS